MNVMKKTSKSPLGPVALNSQEAFANIEGQNGKIYLIKLNTGRLMWEQNLEVIVLHCTALCLDKGLVWEGHSYSSYQAYEIFSEPQRLLPSPEANFSVGASLKEESGALTSRDSSQSLYRVELTTSNAVYSSLSDINAGIMLCLIGENGNSIMQRIPAVAPDPEALSPDTAKIVQPTSDHLCFQRVMEIVLFANAYVYFLAHQICIKPGSWRLGGVKVLVICPSQSVFNGANNVEQQNNGNLGLNHFFRTDEILLGDGGDLSAAELKPCEIQELSGVDMWMKSLDSNQHGTGVTSKDVRKLQQESLREYTDLKFSLLLYSGILVVSGTSITALVGSQEISNGFAIGGVCGFIYLLLLQRAVDRLPEPPSFPSPSHDGSINEEVSFQDDNSTESKMGQGVEDRGLKELSMSINRKFWSKNENFQEVFAGFRGPLTSLAWIIAAFFLASRYFPGNIMISLKPQQLLAGAAGFLICKVAVVIAAFRTIPADWKDHRK
eukprot:Gb_39557 [translate_table: standard]